MNTTKDNKKHQFVFYSGVFIGQKPATDNNFKVRTNAHEYEQNMMILPL